MEKIVIGLLILVIISMIIYVQYKANSIENFYEGEERKCYLTGCEYDGGRKKQCDAIFGDVKYKEMNKSSKKYEKADWKSVWKKRKCSGSLKDNRRSANTKSCGGKKERVLCAEIIEPPTTNSPQPEEEEEGGEAPPTTESPGGGEEYNEEEEGVEDNNEEEGGGEENNEEEEGGEEPKRKCYLTGCEHDGGRKKQCDAIFGDVKYKEMNKSSKKYEKADWKSVWKKRKCFGSLKDNRHGSNKKKCGANKNRVLCAEIIEPPTTEPPMTEPPTTESPGGPGGGGEETKIKCYLTKCKITENRKKDCKDNLNKYEIVNTSGTSFKNHNWKKKWKEYNCKGSPSIKKGSACPGKKRRSLCRKLQEPPTTESPRQEEEQEQEQEEESREPPTTEPPTTEPPTTSVPRQPGNQKLLSDLIFDHMDTDSTL